MNHLRARTPRARPAEPADTNTVRVSARIVDGVAVGRFETTLPNGHVTGREVRSDNCEKVVAALALALAIMLETDPAFSGVSQPVPASASCPSSLPPRPLLPPALPSASASVQTPARSRWSVGSRVRALSAVAPSALIANETLVEYSDNQESTVQTVLRASLLYGTNLPRTAEPGGRTDLMAARLAACPLGLHTASALKLAACAEVGIGAISVRGEAARPISATRLWSDAGLSAVALLTLSPAVRVELMGGAIVPLTRYVFEVRSPHGVYHTVPVVGATGGIAFIFALP